MVSKCETFGDSNKMQFKKNAQLLNGRIPLLSNMQYSYVYAHSYIYVLTVKGFFSYSECRPNAR